MSLWMMGGGGWQPPFNRTFFNVALGEVLERTGKEKGSRLTLYLVDGTQLDVRTIEEMSDPFLVVKASLHHEEEGEIHLHVLPYASIYRLEVAGAPDEEGHRLGFRWMSAAARAREARKLQTRAEGPVEVAAAGNGNAPGTSGQA